MLRTPLASVGRRRGRVSSTCRFVHCYFVGGVNMKGSIAAEIDGGRRPRSQGRHTVGNVKGWRGSTRAVLGE